MKSVKCSPHPLPLIPTSHHPARATAVKYFKLQQSNNIYTLVGKVKIALGFKETIPCDPAGYRFIMKDFIPFTNNLVLMAASLYPLGS